MLTTSRFESLAALPLLLLLASAASAQVDQGLWEAGKAEEAAMKNWSPASSDPGLAMAAPMLSDLLDSLLTEPSPAEIERRRQIAAEAEARRQEQLARIESEKRALQESLFGELVSLDGSGPSLPGSPDAGPGAGDRPALEGLVPIGNPTAMDQLRAAVVQGFEGTKGGPLVELGGAGSSARARPVVPSVAPPVADGSDLPQRLVARNQLEMEAVLDRHGLDSGVLEEARTATAYAEQAGPGAKDSTQLVFSGANARPGRPKAAINESTAPRSLLEDPEYLRTRQRAFTLGAVEEELEFNMEKKNQQLIDRQIGHDEWDRYNADYKQDTRNLRKVRVRNQEQLEAVYRRHGLRSDQ